MKKIIESIVASFIKSKKRFLAESYDDVSFDYILNLKKLSEYKKYDFKKEIGDYIYLVFDSSDDDDFYIYGKVLVFEKSTGQEVANSSFGKANEHDDMIAGIDVHRLHRRKGIASNVYELIEKYTGQTLYPDYPHSKDAQKLWANPNRKFGVK